MAKKVVKEKGCCDPEYSPSIYFSDLTLKQLKGLEVGEEVTVILKGKVLELSQRETTEGPVKGSLSLQDYEVSIEHGTNIWEDLSEESADE